MATSGEVADRIAFTEYVQRNMSLDEFRSGLRKTTTATAHFIRSTLAQALRRSPYQVNMLLAGFDDVPSKGKDGDADASKGAETDPSKTATGTVKDAPTTGVGPSLYWIDYLGTMQRVNYGVHGHAGYFSSATLDRYWKPNMSEAEALDLLSTCIAQLKTRFIIQQPAFTVRVVSKDGVKDLDLPTKSLPDLSSTPSAKAGAAAATGSAAASGKAAAGGGSGSAPMEL